VGGSWARTNLPVALASATYNAANHQTAFGGQTLTYDLNGNLTGDGTNTYTWNARNQLASITGPIGGSFVYDAFGRRQRTTIDGVITDVVYDGLNPVRQAVGTDTVDLLTGLGIDEYLTRTDASSTRDLLSDALGSTLTLTDASGTVQTEYSYEPFGAVTASGSSSSNELRYTGREDDGTSLYYYRARYYHPGLQRFISEDPLEFGGGDVNLFNYVRNMPTRLRDPLGLFTVESDCDPITTLSGRKDKDAVAEGCGPVGPMYASNLDERNRAEEFAKRPVLHHVLRQTMLRKLQQARAQAKPGHSPTIQGGPRTAENVFDALRGSRPYRPHTDTTGGGSGYKFTDPELGTVILRYTDHGGAD
jgi:RHS repeat-associated protein